MRPLLIHNIWAGDIPDDLHDHIETCKKKFGNSYRFWCFSNDYQSSRLRNSQSHQSILPDITGILMQESGPMCFLDTPNGPKQWLIDHNPGWEEIINRLIQARAFSALKDIFEIVILYLQGGIYLDTSIDINRCDMQTFDLATQNQGPKFVYYPESLSNRDLEGNAVDVWLAYSPANSALFEKILLFLYRAWHRTFHVHDGFRVLCTPYTGPLVRNPREEIIGSNIIIPVINAIQACTQLQKESNSPMLEFSANSPPRDEATSPAKSPTFPAFPVGFGLTSFAIVDLEADDVASDPAVKYVQENFWPAPEILQVPKTVPTRIVRSLNLIKYFKNSWRKHNVSDLAQKYGFA